MWASDDDGTLTFSNPAGAKLLGIDDLVGRSLGGAHPRDDKRRGLDRGRAAHPRRRQPAHGRHALGAHRATAGRASIATSARPGAGAGPAGRRRVVRWPVVDGRREVVGYELRRRRRRARRRSRPTELLELGGGRPVWVSLDGDDAPELAAMRTVLQIAPDTAPERAQALRGGRLRARARRLRGRRRRCSSTAGSSRSTSPAATTRRCTALIAEPAERGLELVATGVATADEFTRCRVLGFSHFQGEFFARPRGEGGGRARSPRCRRCRELTGARRLLRGARADHRRRRRALARAAAPRQLGLLRAPAQDRHDARGADPARHARGPALGDGRRALLDARGPGPARRARAAARRACASCWRAARARRSATRLFTVGLFSVADALLDAPMEEVLETLPFSEEIVGRAAAPRGPAAGACWPPSCATSRAASRRRGRPDGARATPTSPRSDGPTGRVAGSPDEPDAAAVQAHAGVHRA